MLKNNNRVYINYLYNIVMHIDLLFHMRHVNIDFDIEREWRDRDDRGWIRLARAGSRVCVCVCVRGSVHRRAS